MSVFAPPGGRGEVGRAGLGEAEDCAGQPKSVEGERVPFATLTARQQENENRTNVNCLDGLS